MASIVSTLCCRLHAVFDFIKKLKSKPILRVHHGARHFLPRRRRKVSAKPLKLLSKFFQIRIWIRMGCYGPRHKVFEYEPVHV